jgi:hypothetical protein
VNRVEIQEARSYIHEGRNTNELSILN